MKANKKTSGDRFIKTTINLRARMMADVHERMTDLGKEDLIDYLRDLICLDTKHKILGTFDPVSLTVFRGQINFPREETAQEALDRIKRPRRPLPYFGPPRKYSGFTAGRARWRILRWCQQWALDWKGQQYAVKARIPSGMSGEGAR